MIFRAPSTMSDLELERELELVATRMMLAQTYPQRRELWQQQQRLMAEQEKRGLR